jgi:class 3 adenylate cyclase
MIDKKSTMANRINKTSICSILFLDIIDYSEKSDADQIEIKSLFNDLISLSLESVAKDDRIILDTGDGIAIAYMGSPEDLMFVALTIRDGILKSNMHCQNPLFVRSGINLGPVRIVSDINGRPNIIGDGINVAQRIMSFSEPNQILVSRSFYEITSRLTVEFSEMFAYSGVKQDKHVRDHEVYSVRSHANQVASIGQPDTPKDERRSINQPKVKNKFNWNYAIPSLVVIAAIIVLAKLISTPSEPIITLAKSAISIPKKVSASFPLPAKPIKEFTIRYFKISK